MSATNKPDRGAIFDRGEENTRDARSAPNLLLLFLVTFR
jgi:hypothetical protein